MTTLNQLHYFVEVCDSGSMTEAAKRLNVSQPSVTVAIKDLERKWDVLLLDRSGSKLRTTAEGQALYERAVRLLSDARSIDELMARMRENNETLRIGFSSAFARLYPNIVEDYLKEHPNAHIKSYVYGSAGLTRYIESEELDAAFFDCSRNIRAHRIPLTSVDCCLYVNKKNPLSKSKSIDISKDLENEKMVVFRESTSDSLESNEFDIYPELAAPNTHVVLTTNQFGEIEDQIARGSACSIMPEGALGNNPNVASIPIEPTTKIRFDAFWSSTRLLNSVSEFINYAKEYVKR